MLSHDQGKLHQQLQSNFTVGFLLGEKMCEKNLLYFFNVIYRNPLKTLWYSENHEIPVFIVLPFIQKASILKELLALVLPLSCHRKKGCEEA